MLRGCRAHTVRDLKPETMEGFLHRLEDRGLAASSINSYLDAIKAMLAWAVRTQLLPYNPLQCVAKRPVLQKRRLRRALNDEEIGRLLAAGLEGPARRALRIHQNRPRKDGSYKAARLTLEQQAALAREGRNNTLAYRLMLETGLRRNEVRLLSWADVDLDAGTLTTRPWWVGNKNGKEETLPLPPGLWAELNSWHEKHADRDSGCVVKVTDRLLRQFNDDLVAAGLARRVPYDAHGNVIALNAAGLPVRRPAKWKVNKYDAAGRVLDLHALRHTFGTRLGHLPGVDPKTVQTLMRHSDPRLTFTVYVHADRARLRAAVGSLADLGPTPKSDASSDPRVAPPACRTPRVDPKPLRTRWPSAPNGPTFRRPLAVPWRYRLQCLALFSAGLH